MPNMTGHFLAALLVIVAALVVATPAPIRISDEPLQPMNASDNAGFKLGDSCKYFVMAVQLCQGHTSYTIHGLWPQFSKSSWPEYCSKENFNPSAVSNISSILRTFWPSCKGASENHFLGHEWTKHGTCTGWSQYKYFETALTVFNTTNWKSKCGSKTNCKVHVYLKN
eukprot:PhM_4_TR11412/c0_g1_i1/m.19962/K01166/E3.1.27.1; ribonuclease T2